VFLRRSMVVQAGAVGDKMPLGAVADSPSD